MIDFKIDQNKCIQCGLCVTECPVLIINGKSTFPEIKEGKEEQCIKCQHCLAICPTGALSIWGKNPDDSLPVDCDIPSPEQMSNLIKTRRSIRRFSKKELDSSLVQDLLQTAHYAPSGHNKNAVMFSVTQSKADLLKLRERVYDAINTAHKNNTLPKNMLFLFDLYRLWNTKGIDVLFRDAPHVIMASAPQNLVSPKTDCHVALSYFELLANSQGIGILWNGFVKMILDTLSPEIKTQIGIPEDHVLGYVLLFGKPGVKFKRAVQKNEVSVNRIQL